MSVRYFTPTIMALGFLSCLHVNAQEAAPKPAFAPENRDVDRYRHIWEKSPFVTETKVVQQTGALSERFILTGVASLQDEPVIFVLDRKSLVRLMVTKEPNADGLSLISVQRVEDPKQAMATIQLASEQGVIKYDTVAMTAVNQGGNAEAKPGSGQPVASAEQNPTNTVPGASRTIRRIRPIKITN